MLNQKTKNLLPLLIIFASLLILLPLVIFLIQKTSPEDAAQQSLDEEIFAEAEDYYKKYPIIELLPYLGDGFRIDYGLCELSENDFCLRVSALSSTLPRAVEFLTSLESYDISDYLVEFPDFICPFDKSSLDPSALELINLENNYYLSTLSYENYEGTKISYKLLLEKSGSSYKILTDPEFIFSLKKYPSLPSSVLTLANKS